MQTSDETEYNPFIPRRVQQRFRIPVVEQLAVLAVILLIIFAGAASKAVTAFLETSLAVAPPPETPAAVAAPNITEGEEAVTFADITLVAEAAYVYDVREDRVLFEKNAAAVLPLASITKLMTALVAHELLSEEEKVTISDASLRQYGNSGLNADETFSRQTLTDLVLMSSSNDGAYALAAAAGAALGTDANVAAFVGAMNIRARELGLESLTFKNTTGLDISATESGADGTVADTARLMAYIVKNAPDLLTLTTEESARLASEDGQTHDGQNTNAYISDIPGLIGSKTGYTALAGGNLVIAFNAGLDRPVVVAVLGSGRQSRFSDVEVLVAATQHAILTGQHTRE